MTDEAEVEHELVPAVLVVLDDDGVAADLLRQDIDGHGAASKLLLRDDVDAENKDKLERGAAQHTGRILASHPAAPDLIPTIPVIFSEEKLSMLLRLINSAG